jgi:general secretion pathway protein K
MATPRDLRPAGRSSERGAALLVVMVAIAILTALAVDLAYETRVRLQIAANGRDELRAQALARSAVNLSRLVLTWQAQLDDTAAQACKAMPVTPPATPKQPPTSPPCPRVQLWDLIPVSSGLAEALWEGGGAAVPAAEEEGAPATTTASFGDFQGGFDTRVEDEGTKVNVQLDELGTSGFLGPKVDALLRLTCDGRWDPLFDREDVNGQRYSRADLPVLLRDYVDEDAKSSSLLASFVGGSCGFTVPTSPFEEGFGDENYPYERGPDRYRAKNARLDSLDELFMVAGVGDAFMAAFGDHLTVYQPRDGKVNVNTADPVRQLQIALVMAEPTSVAVIADPAFGPRLAKALSDLRMGGILTTSPPQFAAVLEALGVAVKTEYRSQNPKNLFTDRSFAFRIRALGAAGDVSKTIDAVVTYDPAQNKDAKPGQPSAGRLIRWREE